MCCKAYSLTKFCSPDTDLYHASDASNPWHDKETVAICISITALKTFSILHNNEMASNHRSIRKAVTCIALAIGVAITSLTLGSIELIARVALGILTSPLLFVYCSSNEDLRTLSMIPIYMGGFGALLSLATIGIGVLVTPARILFNKRNL